MIHNDYILPAQSWTLHVLVWLMGCCPHAVPLFSACRITSLVLVWLPPPHSLVHGLHSPKSLKTQSPNCESLIKYQMNNEITTTFNCSPNFLLRYYTYVGILVHCKLFVLLDHLHRLHLQTELELWPGAALPVYPHRMSLCMLSKS